MVLEQWPMQLLYPTVIKKGGISMIEVGTMAPDFSLKDQHGKNQGDSLHKDNKVLLSFRPLAWTPI